MTINGINGANSRAGQMGMTQATDSYSRNIQNQIANAQKQLQELSSNEEMSLEEKMKKRQEIQQQISELSVQLRQHQMEQRKEKQQAKGFSMDDASAGTRNAEIKSTGLSQTSMTAILSANSSLKQAKAQGSAATSLEGKARVLKSEMKTSQGASLEKKKEELADIEQKAQAATSSQLSTLAGAINTMEKAAKTESKTEKTTESGAKKEKEENVQGNVAETDAQTKNAEDVQTENGIQEKAAEPVETSAPEASVSQTAAYMHVDVRL